MSTVTATVKTVDYLESRLAIEWWESGSGDPPMLLMHGGNGFSPAPPYVEMLCQSQRVIAAQHPGYGDSERPGWMDTVSDLAHFYLELIESEGLEDVTLVGFSSGGWIAAEMAVWRPQRIGRVVLVDAVGIRVGGPTERDIADIFSISREERARLGFVDPSMAGLTVSEMSDEELARLVQAEETTALYYWEPYMCNPKLRRRLAAIRIPCAVIWGASDRVVTPDYGRLYAESLGNAELSIVEGSGHCPHIERPEEFCRLVQSFVSRTAAS
jgi:pimeloyl-ACP methyl ester carboxylesterase